MKKVIKIEVDCAVCAQKCEEAIKKIEGVESCSINFMTQKMIIQAKDDQFSEILKLGAPTGQRIHRRRPSARTAH